MNDVKDMREGFYEADTGSLEFVTSCYLAAETVIWRCVGGTRFRVL